MNAVFEKYKISSDLSCDEQLALLEKVKQKLLRKLNHVFGDPEKEEELNREMDQLEKVMDALRTAGGTMSLDDVDLELRELTQTVVDPETKKEQEIQEKERRIQEEELELREKYSLITDVVVHYMRKQDHERYGYWCQYGANLGIGFLMEMMYEYHTEEKYGAMDSTKAFYWLKKAAEAGEKDSCEILGKRYLDPDSPLFDPKQSVIWSVKAADAEHPDAYFQAFRAFYWMERYDKAEICLKAAHDLGVGGAAYFLGYLYDTERNKTGMRQTATAKTWYEIEYQREPGDAICFKLGELNLELGEIDAGVKLLLQGAEEFDSEECLNALNAFAEKNRDVVERILTK